MDSWELYVFGSYKLRYKLLEILSLGNELSDQSER